MQLKPQRGSVDISRPGLSVAMSESLIDDASAFPLALDVWSGESSNGVSVSVPQSVQLLDRVRRLEKGIPPEIPRAGDTDFIKKSSTTKFVRTAALQIAVLM